MPDFRRASLTMMNVRCTPYCTAVASSQPYMRKPASPHTAKVRRDGAPNCIPIAVQMPDPDESVHVLEIFARGTLVYLSLFVLLRVVLKREAGTVGMSDLLVVVLIADAAQNAMADDYHSVPDGLVLVATIVFWSYVIDWLGFRFPRLRRFTYPPPLALVRDGKVMRANLRRELVTMDELMSQIRMQGLEDVADVKLAYMEGDGRISVVKREEEQHAPPPRVRA